MCECMCLCVCMWLSVCTFVHVCVRARMTLGMCACACAEVYPCVRTCVCTCVCARVRVCVCVCVLAEGGEGLGGRKAAKSQDRKSSFITTFQTAICFSSWRDAASCNIHRCHASLITKGPMVQKTQDGQSLIDAQSTVTGMAAS